MEQQGPVQPPTDAQDQANAEARRKLPPWLPDTPPRTDNDHVTNTVEDAERYERDHALPDDWEDRGP